MTRDVEDLARLLWDYHQMNHRLERSDVIVAQGSHDLRVAERGAQLFLEGYAPLLVMSGGLGNFTRDLWDEPEADKFAGVARELGVPEDAILVENASTNTGENVVFTRRLLREKRIEPRSIILVHKPYMERRAFATFKRVWPDRDAVVTSPQIGFDDYPTDEIPKDRVIDIMVGDLQRIRVYPERGFQIAQTIPAEVWEAYEALVEMGFTGNLLRDA